MAHTIPSTCQNIIEELLRRTEITCKARYHSARRMKMHSWFSQWTLSMLAVGQIVISIIPPLGMTCNVSANYISFSSIFFGILILAYSLLLGMGNYSERSVKLHGCGLELGRLARKLFQLKSKNSYSEIGDDYKECSKNYYDILDKYENHTRADYLVAHYEYYSSYKIKRDETDSLGKFVLFYIIIKMNLISVRYKIYIFHALQFSHYVISILLIWSWIAYMILPKSLTIGST